jgi:hypothetical protein
MLHPLSLEEIPHSRAPAEIGRLSKQDYDEAAALRVSWALGVQPHECRPGPLSEMKAS